MRLKTKLSIKVLSLLLAGVMTFGLASCQDDEMEFEPEPDVSIMPPTEDEVKTTVGKSYAVIGSNFDEVTPYVLKRMTGKRYDYAMSDTYIADDVEVVFIDTDALLDLSEEMAYELKDVFDRGGSIYLHKPNSFALGIYKMLMDDVLDDFMEWLKEQLEGGAKTRTELDGDPLTRESYVMSCNRDLDVADIYDGKPVTTQVIVTDSLPDGTAQTRTEEQTFTPGEPTAYEYGRFAERIAAWINENGEPATRAVPGYSRQLNQVEITQLIPCRLQRDGDNKVLTTQAEMKAWVSCLYSFDDQQDYYHVVLQESYPGKEFYFGKYYKFGRRYGSGKVPRYNYYAGYTYGGCTIHPTLHTDGFPITRAWNPQPTAEGANHTEYETIDSWSANTYIASHDGTFGLHRDAYTHRIRVEKTSDELNISMKPGDNKDYTWNIDLGSPLYYRCLTGLETLFMNSDECHILEGIPEESSLTRSTCTTRQSWNWIVANTTDRKNKPFTMDVHTTFRAKGAKWEVRDGGIQTTQNVYDGTVSFNLPVPHRYREVYEITCDQGMEGDEWAAIEKVFQKAPSYRLVAGNVTHYTKQKLDDEIEHRWNTFKAELQGRLIDITGNYTFRLKNREGKEIGTPLYIGPHGGVTYEVGSYFLKDGSFLPPNTKPGAVNFTKVAGIVCYVYSEPNEEGIRGYVMALNDARTELCAWGNTRYNFEENDGEGIEIKTSRAMEDSYQNTQNIMEAATFGGKEPSFSKEWYAPMYFVNKYREEHKLPAVCKGWMLPAAELLTYAISNIDDRFDQNLRRVGGRLPRKDGSYYATSSVNRYSQGPHIPENSVYSCVYGPTGFEYYVPAESMKKQFLVRLFTAF